MEKFIPDMYQKSIYTIDYSNLWLRGIKCLLFDLDNTLVPHSIKEPTIKNKELFQELQEMGFKVIIFSNARKERIKPFKEILNVDSSYLSMKPFKKKFLKVIDMFEYELSEVAIIGDQLMTDILGGNKVGITTILVNPVSVTDGVYTRFYRFLERRIINKLSKKDLFKKGRYYE